MPPEDEVLQEPKALAGFYVVSDNGLKRSSAKLRDGVGPGTAEGYYLLAAYCFDLARRLYYLTEITRPFQAHADPALRRRVRADNDYIQGGDDDTWESRARRAEEVLRRLAGEPAALEHDAFMQAEESTAE